MIMGNQPITFSEWLKKRSTAEYKPRKQLSHQESRLQASCVTWFRLQYPEYYYNFYSVPNGVHTSRTQAIILKQEGMVAGVSDLILDVPRGEYHGLRIEMKTHSKGSRQRDTQVAFQKAMEKQGYAYVICRSLEEFIGIIKSYLEGGPNAEC